MSPRHLSLQVTPNSLARKKEPKIITMHGGESFNLNKNESHQVGSINQEREVTHFD